MIEYKETHMEYMLNCSLRQDNLAQEERNTGVKYMRER